MGVESPSHRGVLGAVVSGIGATGRRLRVQRVVLVLEPALALRMVVHVVRPVRAGTQITRSHESCYV